MPPKIKPRPRQSARNNPNTTREHVSPEALSAPSPKEALTYDDNEMQETSSNAERMDEPDIQPKDSTSSGISPSTPSAVASSPPLQRSMQRLKSALPRKSPNPASSLNATDGSNSRPTGLKFKPKSFIRRSKEEREADEKAEAERRAARQVAEGTSSTNDRGGYHGRGRGRGGFGDMNRWKAERFNLSHEASGHLGGSTIQDGTTSRIRRGGGLRSATIGSSVSASPHVTSRAKKEPTVKPEKDKDGDIVMGSSTSKSKRPKVKKEEQGLTYISSETELDSEEGERVNIEDISTINLVSSEDEDEELDQRSRTLKGKGREATPRVFNSNLMPVRIQRQEHVERAVGVNTEASSLTSAELRRRAKARAETEGSLFLPEQEEVDALSLARPKVKRKPKDVEFVRDERKWKGVYQEDDKEGMIKIKTEPGDEENVEVTEKPIDDEEVEPIPFEDMDFQKTSTHGTANGNDHAPGLQASHESQKETIAADSPRQAERLPRIKGYHSLRPVNISEEEEEDDILAEIAEIVSAKSGVSAETSNPEFASSTKAPNEDSDLDMDHEDSYFQKGGREQVYLFQLPPVVPSLRDLSKAVPKFEDKKKNKAVSADLSRSSASNNPFAAQVKDEPIIKADPDELPHETAAVPHAYTSDCFHSTGGRGGVLSIHAKGSMFATWGGMSLEITKEGTGAMLAQELIMTDFESVVTKVEDENRWEEKIDVGSRGWAMGQIQPGHVCVPELLL